MELAEQLAQQVRLKIEKNQLILPSPPDTLLILKKLSEDPDARINELINAISRDPALVLRIMRVANSVIYTTHQPVSNISQAITRLGLKLINTLIISHQLMQMFSQPPGRFSDFVRRLHQHSIEVASYAYAMAKQYKHLDADEALMAGLIHDIGYLPLLQVVAPLQDEPVETLLQALHEVHIDVGYNLALNWKFPLQVCRAIQQHENYDYRYEGKPDLTEILIISNLASYTLVGVKRKKPENIPALDKLQVDLRTPLKEQTHLSSDFQQATLILEST